MKDRHTCDVDCVFDGLDGRGAIYISDFASANLPELRKRLNIVAVISIASSGYLEEHRELLDYLYIPAQDSDVYEISKHFSETNEFLDRHRKLGNVLVHCMVGKSRSATIVAAYMLKKYKYSLSDVMNLLRRKRKKIDPNPGFIRQLEHYCDRLGVPIGRQVRGKSQTLRNRNQNQRKERLSRVSLSKQGKSSQITNETRSELKSATNDISDKLERMKQRLINSRKQALRVDSGHASTKPLEMTGSASLTRPNNIGWKLTKSLEME